MSEDIPFPVEHQGVSHYYGDTVRLLFVVAAVLIIVSMFAGAPFLAPVPAVFMAVLLIIAAGLTNPVQVSIQWVNAGLSVLGVLLFSSLALMRYQEQGGAEPSSILLFLLVLDFVVALYFAIRTLRGVLMRDAPFIR